MVDRSAVNDYVVENTGQADHPSAGGSDLQAVELGLIPGIWPLEGDYTVLMVPGGAQGATVPSIFGENLFDDFFDDGFLNAFGGRNPLFGKHAKNMMKTDVRETDSTYEIDVDLPGFKKDEINVNLEDGYLTISAAKGLDKDEKDKKGKYIRQERYAGAMSRSFYVGDV